MAELQVSKKSIAKLFSEMQRKKFVIPDFQRPYKWDIEKCETLWNDIENFASTEAKNNSDYFLGTIVSYKNDDGNQDIIDGQQRLTSFFLLLRAFFKKLEDMPEDDDVIGLKNQLAPCILDINPISQKVSDKSKIHIESRVATEEDNATFHDILETGDSASSAKDNYSANYRFFKNKCDVYAGNNPMQWKQLCISILQQCVILPIECDTTETALTIFSTLNDRGMPLADSDIFKAQIYRNLATGDERKVFTDAWKELMQITKQAEISIDDVFRYYSHALRARAGDKSREVGLRKFYAQDKYLRLKDTRLINEISSLSIFWRYVNAKLEPDEPFTYKISISARKYLECLSCYPNEFWKYAVSVFFLSNINSLDFEEDFCRMLQKLTAFLFVKFIEAPTVNAIKDDIYLSCITLQNKETLSFSIDLNEASLKEKIDEYSSSKLTRALLLLDVYLNKEQINLIKSNAEIEHIFPKKWQDTNYNGWNRADAEYCLERFGNKVLLEKKLNIQAGNGYFGVKKQRYAESKIASVIELSCYHKADWVKEDIEAREVKFKSNIISFFKEQLV